MLPTLPTERIALDPADPDPTALGRAAAVIRAGGLVAFPTETVYGLGANALDPAAAARIFVAKRRPAHDPLIVHVAAFADLERLVRDWPPGGAAAALAARFWPGPLTLVLPRHERVPGVVTAGGPTVAVRCPNHPLALALLRAAVTPVAAPSANLFGHTSPTTAQHVWDDLAGRIDLILDGGPTPLGVESTVLDLTADPPAILRPGGVTREELAAVLGGVLGEVQAAPLRAPDAPLASPGLLARHYAPHTPLHLFAGDDATVTRCMAAAAQAAQAQGKRVALLIADEDYPAFATLDCLLVSLGALADPAGIARALYGSLRALDGVGVDLILARDVAAVGIGAAIHDRLRRAADAVFAAC
jgi:L-threonylcarbamoyladenylate synthase